MRVSKIPRLAMIAGVCLALVAPLSSCGGGDGGVSGGTDPGFTVTLTMRASNGAETASFAFGNPVVFDMTVTNRSGGAQVLTLPSSQVYDLAVFPDGSPVPRWRWSFNRTFTPAATALSFTGHQSITYLYVWPGVLEDGTQIMPGSYDVRGTLAFAGYVADWGANDELGAAPRKITITN
jgi:hypothetical protein